MEAEGCMIATSSVSTGTQLFLVCKTCFLKVEERAKNQTVVDVVQVEVDSCWRGRGLLGEGACIL